MQRSYAATRVVQQPMLGEQFMDGSTRVELQCAVIHARCSPYFWMDADLRHGLMEVANIANPSGDVMSESSRGGRCGAERRGYKALLWC